MRPVAAGDDFFYFEAPLGTAPPAYDMTHASLPGSGRVEDRMLDLRISAGPQEVDGVICVGRMRAGFYPVRGAWYISRRSSCCEHGP